MNPIVVRLYWQLLALLLVRRLDGGPLALVLLIALGAAQALHFIWMWRGWRARDAQVRLVFFTLLLAGLLPGGVWLHGLQFAGVPLLLVADYRLLARLLDLAPWNRDEPLSAGLLRRTLLTPPSQRRPHAGALAAEVSPSAR